MRYAVTIPYGKTKFAWNDITVYVSDKDRTQKDAYRMCQRYISLHASGDRAANLMACLLDSMNGAKLQLQIGTELMAPSASCNAYDVQGIWIKLSSYEKQPSVHRGPVKQIPLNGTGMKYRSIQRVNLRDADPTKARKPNPQAQELAQLPASKVSTRPGTTIERMQGWVNLRSHLCDLSLRLFFL